MGWGGGGGLCAEQRDWGGWVEDILLYKCLMWVGGGGEQFFLLC